MSKDDDSEPILGQWFEETLMPKETNSGLPSIAASQPSSDVVFSDNKTPVGGTLDSGNLVPEKGEPNGVCFISSIPGVPNPILFNRLP